MEIKKSAKANLENKKVLFGEIGLVIALLIVFAAFEYKSAEISVMDLSGETLMEDVEELDIPITEHTPPPPPETPKVPILSDIIDIVDNEIQVDESLNLSLEDFDNIGVEIMEYVQAVEDEFYDEEEIPFAIVEIKPMFMGGDQNTFSKWVSDNMVYPETARENGVQGIVYIGFTVNADGTVSNVRVIRGIDSSLDKEAQRIVSSSPKWTPGKQRDKAVKVNFTFPIRFQLR